MAQTNDIKAGDYAQGIEVGQQVLEVNGPDLDPQKIDRVEVNGVPFLRAVDTREIDTSQDLP